MRKPFRGVVIPVFEPKAIKGTLKQFVSNLTGGRDEVHQQLLKYMFWEYE